MDKAALLRELNGWPADAKLDLIETVWDQLVDQGFAPALTNEQEAELDRRAEMLDRAPRIALAADEAFRITRR